MEERAFLDAIADNPDDDVARLVYADWLQERDRPEDEARADLIRIQVRLAQLRPDQADVEPLRRRERELLDQYETAWRQHLPVDTTGRWRWGAFERGFVETVEIDDWPTFEPVIAEVFHAQPVRQLMINGLTPESISPVVACESLGQLTALTLGRNRDGHLLAESLTRSEYLAGLRLLSAHANGWGEDWANAIRKARAWPELRSLVLSNSRWTDLDSFAVLFGIEHCEHLRELNLRDSAMTAGALVRAMTSPMMEALASLDVGRCRITGRDLAPAPSWPSERQLNHLNISWNDLGTEGLTVLARTSALGNLQRVELASCRLTAEAVHHLTEASFWPRLTELDLSRNELTDAGLQTLTQVTPPENLRSLNLTQTRIAEFRPLAEWPGLATLECLRVCDNPTAGIFRLLASRHTTALRTLTLSRIGLGEPGVQLLVNGPLLTGLRELHLSHNQIGDRGAHMLAEAPAISELACLRLEGNPITDAGAKALLASPHLDNLWRLYLDGHRLSERMIEDLRVRFGPFVMTG